MRTFRLKSEISEIFRISGKEEMRIRTEIFYEVRIPGQKKNISENSRRKFENQIRTLVLKESKFQDKTFVSWFDSGKKEMRGNKVKNSNFKSRAFWIKTGKLKGKSGKVNSGLTWGPDGPPNLWDPHSWYGHKSESDSSGRHRWADVTWCSGAPIGCARHSWRRAALWLAATTQARGLPRLLEARAAETSINLHPSTPAEPPESTNTVPAATWPFPSPPESLHADICGSGSLGLDGKEDFLRNLKKVRLRNYFILLHF